MAVRFKRVWWIALLLAGALVLHLFMLTGVPGEQPAHRGNAVAAPWDHLNADGHGGPSVPHSPHDMLSTCFAVLALVTAGIAHLGAARLQRSSHELDDHLRRPGRRVDHATRRNGPSGPSRVDAGVLLRV